MTDYQNPILRHAPDVEIEFDESEFDCDCPVHLLQGDDESVVLINGNSEMIGSLAMPLIMQRPRIVTERQAFALVIEMLEALIRDVVRSHFRRLGDLVQDRDGEVVAEMTFNPLSVELLIKNLPAFSAYERAKQSIVAELLVIAEMNKREMDEAEALDVASLGATLIDGIERNKENPTSFEIPDAREVANLKRGDYVKVGLEGGAVIGGGERFWCEVANINGKGERRRITLRVMDELICYPTVPLGKKMIVEPRHIIAID